MSGVHRRAKRDLSLMRLWTPPLCAIGNCTASTPGRRQRFSRRSRTRHGLIFFRRGAEMEAAVTGDYCSGMIQERVSLIRYVEARWMRQSGRMEVGFNLYYTFRQGETAWLHMPKLLRERFRITSFVIDPYQLGHESDRIRLVLVLLQGGVPSGIAILSASRRSGKNRAPDAACG